MVLEKQFTTRKWKNTSKGSSGDKRSVYVGVDWCWKQMKIGSEVCFIHFNATHFIFTRD